MLSSMIHFFNFCMTIQKNNLILRVFVPFFVAFISYESRLAIIITASVIDFRCEAAFVCTSVMLACI